MQLVLGGLNVQMCIFLCVRGSGIQRGLFLKPALWVLERVPCREHTPRCPSSPRTPAGSLGPPRPHCRLPQVPSHHPLAGQPDSGPSSCASGSRPPPGVGFCVGGSRLPSPFLQRPLCQCPAWTPWTPPLPHPHVLPPASTHRTLSQACPACLCLLFRSLPPQLARLLPWAPTWFGPQFILHVAAKAVLSKHRRS